MILGIDEVGRGPYAGPLVVGACILPSPETIQSDPERYSWIFKLTDSKKLTAKQREVLYEKIKSGALASATGWVSSSEIDKYGISESLKLACRRVVKKIQETKVAFSEIIIDGTMNFLGGTSLEKYVSTLKKGDLLIKEISAASIIAKVERDRYMIKLSEKYPEYGFEKHVGYGTRLHQAAMEKFGLTPEHRKSFRPVREIWEKAMEAPGDEVSSQNEIDAGSSMSRGKLLQKQTFDEKNGRSRGKTTKSLGDKGEDMVADFLESKGHKIVARNFKTKLFEIDIISVCEVDIVFTEVKYRRANRFGESIEFVDANKHRQISFAAEGFLVIHPEYKILTPKLAVAGVSGEDFQLDHWFLLDE